MSGDEAYETLTIQYREFFENPHFEDRYIDRVRSAIEDGKFRVLVNMNDLRNFGYADR
jgi:hypothetical protein